MVSYDASHSRVVNHSDDFNYRIDARALLRRFARLHGDLGQDVKRRADLIKEGVRSGNQVAPGHLRVRLRRTFKARQAFTFVPRPTAINDLNVTLSQ